MSKADALCQQMERCVCFYLDVTSFIELDDINRGRRMRYGFYLRQNEIQKALISLEVQANYLHLAASLTAEKQNSDLVGSFIKEQKMPSKKRAVSSESNGKT